MVAIENGDFEKEQEPEVDLCTQTIRNCVQHPAFDACILVTIVVNSVMMAWIGPEPPPGSVGDNATYWTLMLFTPLYTIEMILKMWGLGLWRNEESYLIDNWCRFDLFVVVASWVDVGLMLATFMSGDTDRSNLLVARLVRMCRVFRILKGSIKFEASRIMVFVVLRTIVNCKWVFCIVMGFVLCVCTLGLNWFGSEMRYKCVLVDGLVDGAGQVFSLSDDDKNQLTLGKAWDEVTSDPYRLQIPARFCRHGTRPGPKSWGQSCDLEDGMMCVFIDEPPFGDMMGFENIGSAILTVLFIILQQQFDQVVLSTMQATVHPSAYFFALIMVFGGFFLLEYVTAVLCITYAEITTVHEDFSDNRQNADQTLLQIELSEGAQNRADESLDDIAEDTGQQIPRKTTMSATITDIRPPGPVGFLEHVWFWKKRMRDWSRREPKTQDVNSHPLLNFYMEVNLEAFSRIQQRVQETRGQDSKIVQLLTIGFDMTAYVLAATIMYPMQASEMHGARGWHGSSIFGVVSHWELGVTVLSTVEVANSIMLSNSRIQSRLDGLEAPDEQSSAGLSWIVWAIFAADMLVKMIAFKGPVQFLHSSLNQLDFTVTTVQFFGMATWMHPNLTGLRVTRWICVLALARKFSKFHILMEKAFGSLSEALLAIFMIVFFIVTVAIAGQQIFAGADWTDYPRPYFGTFYESLVSVIEVSSNDGLLSMLRYGLTVGPYTSVYLIFSTLFVNLLLLRLMIPFMLKNCDESETFKIRYQIFFGKVLGGDALLWEHTKQHAKLLSFFKRHQSDDHDEAEFLRQAAEQNEAVMHALDNEEDKTDSGNTTRKSPLRKAKSITNAVSAWDTYGHLDYKDDDDAVQMSEVRKFKKSFINVMHSQWYEPFMALLVIATSFVYGAQPRLDWNFPEWTQTTLRWALVIWFQFEMILKIWISHGKSASKIPYYKDPWHIMEILAIFGMWNIMFPYLPYARGLSNLRFFHLFRALRTLSIFPDIELAYDRLAAISLDVTYCIFLIGCLIMAFTILAMPLFGGLFLNCDDPDIPDRPQCSGFSYLPVGNPEDEVYLLRGRSWVTPTENFDSFPSALGTSFALFLNTGWSQVIKQATSVTSAGVQPLRYGLGLMGSALIAFQIFAMVLRQLLIAMVINSLKVSSGSGLQTDDQKAWFATQRMCQSKCLAYMSSRGSTGSGWSVAIALKRHWLFRITIEITIIINVVAMLCVTYGASKMQEDIIQSINFFCLVIYYVEMLTALVAEAHVYFLSTWNVFDAIINIVSTLDLYYWYTSVDGGEPSFEIMSLRSARVLRLVKLAGRSPDISILLNFSIKALRTSIGCYLVWFFLMILFAIPANQMFAGIRQSVLVDSTTLSNFDTFEMSIIFLFRIAVQNNFIYEARELQMQAPYCTAVNQTLLESVGLAEGQGDCGPDAVSIWIFFTFFCGLSRLVIVPFIAGSVVFTFFETMDELRSVLSLEEVAKFESCWVTLDPHGTGYIGEWKVPSLMERMRSSIHPLWFDPEAHPDKQVIFTTMLNDEMTTIRSDLKEKSEKSTLFKLKHEKNLGLQPGQVRYDSILNTLTAVQKFTAALRDPQTEQASKMDQICSETFCFTQERIIGAIQRKTVLAKRTVLMQSAPSAAVRKGEDDTPARKGISKKTAQKALQEKEGLQPLTTANLKDFHEEEESWEDPKDFAEMHIRFSVFWLFFSALRPMSSEEPLPVEMKAFVRKPPTTVENWINEHEKRGADPGEAEDDEDPETNRSLTSRRSNTAQTREGGAKSAVSLRSDLDEAKWRVNQGNWSDVGSSDEDGGASMHNMPTARFSGNVESLLGCGPHATVHMFFDATWEEVVGEQSDIDVYMEQLAGDVTFALHVANHVVDVVAFDKKTVCAEAHIHPSSSGRAPATARAISGDPTELAENLKSQAHDNNSDLKMLQPYVSRIEITPPARPDPLAQVGAGIGGVDDIFLEDSTQPPNFFSLVGSVSRGLFL